MFELSTEFKKLYASGEVEVHRRLFDQQIRFARGTQDLKHTFRFAAEAGALSRTKGERQ